MAHADLAFEFMMNALRLTEGFALSLFNERTTAAQHHPAGAGVSADARQVQRDGDWLRLTWLGSAPLNDLLGLFCRIKTTAARCTGLSAAHAPFLALLCGLAVCCRASLLPDSARKRRAPPCGGFLQFALGIGVGNNAGARAKTQLRTSVHKGADQDIAVQRAIMVQDNPGCRCRRGVAQFPARG